jgi:hypothetical protein
VSTRRSRGRETEEAVAEVFRDHGWHNAFKVGSGAPGKDLLGCPGLSCEVKSRRDLNLPAWLRQAAKYDGLPFVIHRPDRFGPRSVGIWPMTFMVKDGVPLLRRAGYGGDAFVASD